MLMEDRSDSAPDKEQTSNWLQILLNKNDGVESPYEVRVAVLRALIIECKRYGVERVLQRFRVRLRWWKYIAWIFTAFKTFCLAVIFVLLWNTYFPHISEARAMASQRVPMLLKMFRQGWVLCIFLVIVVISMEFLLFLVFHIQRSTVVVFAYVVESVFILLIISTIPFLVGVHTYSVDLISETYGLTIATNPVNYETVEAFHELYTCCGFVTADDWFSHDLYRGRTLFTNEEYMHNNNFGWMKYCVMATTEKACYVPHFCCETLGCHHVAEEDVKGFINDFNRYVKTQNGSYMETIPGIIGLSRRPCFHAIAGAVNVQIEKLWRWLVVLALLTLIFTMLIITILLYNSGQGEVIQDRVRSPNYASFVWFFIKLDEKNEKGVRIPDELSGYSIIEDLKKFNVDGDISIIE
ncbi:hypothetical protein Q1695_016386 [Nippostrongylus brasiliensis]|nr:hypothetical protein Q1695_016386 [Nippostrongylus brasiliensis]